MQVHPLSRVMTRVSGDQALIAQEGFGYLTGVQSISRNLAVEFGHRLVVEGLQDGLHESLEGLGGLDRGWSRVQKSQRLGRSALTRTSPEECGSRITRNT